MIKRKDRRYLVIMKNGEKFKMNQDAFNKLVDNYNQEKFTYWGGEFNPYDIKDILNLNGFIPNPVLSENLKLF